jgi:hypothetical protein
VSNQTHKSTTEIFGRNSHSLLRCVNRYGEKSAELSRPRSREKIWRKNFLEKVERSLCGEPFRRWTSSFLLMQIPTVIQHDLVRYISSISKLQLGRELHHVGGFGRMKTQKRVCWQNDGHRTWRAELDIRLLGERQSNNILQLVSLRT